MDTECFIVKLWSFTFSVPYHITPILTITFLFYDIQLVQALRDLGYAQTAVVGTIVEREKTEFAPLVYLEN